MNDITKELKDQLEGEYFEDSLHQSLYATDASVYRKIPKGVAFPKNIEDLKTLIQFANRNNTSLIPRAAGTSLAGQCVGEGIVVDVSKHFTKILAVDKQNKTVTVQPGVIRDELNSYLKSYDLFFGPNTSTSNRCMIGGMVGNNSSGTTSIQYGVTRDKVKSIKGVLSNGVEVEFSNITSEAFIQKSKEDTLEGKIYHTLLEELSSTDIQQEIVNQFPKPEIHRRNTGYAIDTLLQSELFGGNKKYINLAKLLCGSEGTLAFTTEITLQLDDLPPVHSAMVIAHYPTIANCLNDVPKVMQHNLHTCEMMDDVILNCTKNNKKFNAYRYFIEENPKALLMLEVKSNSLTDLEILVNQLIKTLTKSNLSYANPVLYKEDINNALELRKAGLGLLGNMIGDNKTVACIEDTAVAINDLPNYIQEFTELMKSYNQNAVYYAHAGAGELHLRPILNLKTSKGVQLFREITSDVASLVKKYQGSFSGEHGDGIVRGEFLSFMLGDRIYKLLKKIKYAFDPISIFNPGKIIEAQKMDKNLRYLPDRIEPLIDTYLDFNDSKGILRLAEKCNGSGDCRKTEKSPGTMCPSYQATKDEKHTTRGRANILREVLSNNQHINVFNHPDLKEAMSLCLSCKACATECPSNVDIASTKAEFLYQYHKSHSRSIANKLFGKSSKQLKWMSKFPHLSNAIFKNTFTGNILKNIGGIAKKRSVPIVSTKRFNKKRYVSKKQYVSKNKKVLLFVDEFSNYLDNNIQKDAYVLLLNLGYQVEIIDHLDSARALISKGFLEETKKEINKSIYFLKNKVHESVPLLGIEPSAILGFRDEYIRLAEDQSSARKIASNTYLIEEFLAKEIEEGNISSTSFTKEEKNIKIHVHCHQKALSNQKVTFDILNLPLNYTPTLISSGCCGMAGSFGMEKKNYNLSMKIGELRLFPAVRNAKRTTLIAANGTSCRHQIKDGTQREALHPITILRKALID